MKRKLVLIGSYWLVAALIFPFESAWAYIDPATTTYLIQIAAALVITLGVSLSVFIYKFQMIATNAKVSFHALLQRLSKRQSSSETGDSTGKEDAASDIMSEEDALHKGLIDCPISACENFSSVVSEEESTRIRKRFTQQCVSGLSTEKASYTEGDGSGKKSHRPSRKGPSLVERIPVAALVAVAIAVSFFIFGLLDSVIHNADKMSFTFNEVFVPVLLLGFVVFVILFLFFILFRNRIFTFVICLFLSLLVAGYMQMTFFNSSIGTLMGQSLDWASLGYMTVLLNTLMWLAVFVIVFYLGFSKNKTVIAFNKKAQLFIPALLIAVQAIALLSVLTPDILQDTKPREEERLTLTSEKIYDVSQKENIIVFIVDTFDEKYVNTILEEDPHYFDDLDGFTRFTNNIGRYNSTFPSVPNLMTGVPYDPVERRPAYIKEAYAQGTFVEDVRARGFGSTLYMDIVFAYEDGEDIAGLADNLEEVLYTFDATTALKRLVRFSALKAAPLALKAPFSLKSDAFSNIAVPLNPDSPSVYCPDDIQFSHDLKTERLQKTEELDHFTYYHFIGSHSPWIMDENNEYVKEGTDAIRQTKGTFNTIREYIRQMKELGIYKDATIIITGDHPEHMMHIALFEPKLVGLFVKPSGSQGESLKISDAPVAIENLGPTCVEAAGGDSAQWGRSYFEIGENEQTERHYSHRFTDDAGVHHMASYRVVGDARDWNSWELVEITDYPDEGWF